MVCEDPDALDAALDEFAVAESKPQVLSKLTWAYQPRFRNT